MCKPGGANSSSQLGSVVPGRMHPLLAFNYFATTAAILSAICEGLPLCADQRGDMPVV